MTNEKIVRLLEVKVLPKYRDEVLQAVRENKLPTRADIPRRGPIKRT